MIIYIPKYAALKATLKSLYRHFENLATNAAVLKAFNTI